MFVKKDLEKKIAELKENLIYAITEHYEGELEIDDVTDTSFGRMVLKQDKSIINMVNANMAESISEQIKMLENFVEEISEHNGRTVLRNAEIIEDAIFDLMQSIKILTLSIRKNNAYWQAELSEMLEDEDEEENNEDDAPEIDNECISEIFAKIYNTLKKGDKLNDEE